MYQRHSVRILKNCKKISKYNKVNNAVVVIENCGILLNLIKNCNLALFSGKLRFDRVCCVYPYGVIVYPGLRSLRGTNYLPISMFKGLRRH